MGLDCSSVLSPPHSGSHLGGGPGTVGGVLILAYTLRARAGLLWGPASGFRSGCRCKEGNQQLDLWTFVSLADPGSCCA